MEVNKKQTTSDFIEECLLSGEYRKMNMVLIISVERLNKIKRLFMKEEKEDFGNLVPVNTPLDLVEIRRMEMSFFVVPARLKKIKRMVDRLYSANAESALHYGKGKNSVLK